MGIYYYAVDQGQKKYFSSPDGWSVKSPNIYHPENPFPHMVIMMNSRGNHFDILNDCSNDIPPSDNFKDITSEVYAEYLEIFKDYFKKAKSDKPGDGVMEGYTIKVKQEDYIILENEKKEICIAGGEFKKFLEESFNRRIEVAESLKNSREYLESVPDIQPE